MSVLDIKLTDLTESAVTRRRGTEAADALEECIRDATQDTVALELFGLPMISASFIDEIILRVHRVEESKKMDFVFLVRDDSILVKLSRASGLREIPLKYCWQDDPQVRMVKPIKPTTVEVHETHAFPTDYLEAAG